MLSCLNLTCNKSPNEVAVDVEVTVIQSMGSDLFMDHFCSVTPLSNGHTHTFDLVAKTDSQSMNCYLRQQRENRLTAVLTLLNYVRALSLFFSERTFHPKGKGTIQKYNSLLKRSLLKVVHAVWSQKEHVHTCLKMSISDLRCVKKV